MPYYRSCVFCMLKRYLHLYGKCKNLVHVGYQLQFCSYWPQKYSGESCNKRNSLEVELHKYCFFKAMIVLSVTAAAQCFLLSVSCGWTSCLCRLIK